MTRTQSAFAIGGFIVGASLLAREIRRQRAIDLRDRVVLITGGSRGLGLLMAREVGRLGAQVVLVARDEAELLRAQQDLRSHEVTCSILVADVATEAQARHIVSETVAQHGRLDVLINNAGVITVGPVDHMTIADFEAAMATHFWGPLHTMLAAIPHMHAGRRPHREHLVGRRQDWRAASRAVLRQQVRADRRLHRHARRAGALRHPRSLRCAPA